MIVRLVSLAGSTMDQSIILNEWFHTRHNQRFGRATVAGPTTRTEREKWRLL